MFFEWVCSQVSKCDSQVILADLSFKLKKRTPPTFLTWLWSFLTNPAHGQRCIVSFPKEYAQLFMVRQLKSKSVLLNGLLTVVHISSSTQDIYIIIIFSECIMILLYWCLKYQERYCLSSYKEGHKQTLFFKVCLVVYRIRQICVALTKCTLHQVGWYIL